LINPLHLQVLVSCKTHQMATYHILSPRQLILAGSLNPDLQGLAFCSQHGITKGKLNLTTMVIKTGRHFMREMATQLFQVDRGLGRLNCTCRNQHGATPGIILAFYEAPVLTYSNRIFKPDGRNMMSQVTRVCSS